MNEQTQLQPTIHNKTPAELQIDAIQRHDSKHQQSNLAQTGISTAGNQSLAVPNESFAGLMREAMASGRDPAYMAQLLAVRETWLAGEARKSFNYSISEFQRRAPIIEKADKAYDKQYARMDRIWREIRPLLTELGLSITWQMCELRDGMCHVEGQLRHKDGHGERLAQDIPLPELVKGQNHAQQMGSARTYAQRYAICGALGIVTGDDLDDDGNKAGTTFITFDQAQAVNELIQACRGLATWKEEAFWGAVGCGAKATSEIPAIRHDDVVKMLKVKLKQGGAMP